MTLRLTGDQIVKITKHLGIRFINANFNTLRLEIDAKLEELNDIMLPDKNANKNEDFTIPKEFIKQYVELMELMDEILELHAEAV